MPDFSSFDDKRLDEFIACHGFNQSETQAAIAERQRRQLQRLSDGQSDLKSSVERLGKPHRVVWWTLWIALATLVVCIIGYWDQIKRLLLALKFW